MKSNAVKFLVAALTFAVAAHAQTMDSREQLPKPISEKVDASALLASPRLVSRIIIHFAEGDVRSRNTAELDQMLNTASRASGQQLRYVRTLGEGGVLVEIQNPGAVSKNLDVRNHIGPGVPHTTVISVMETVALDPGVVNVEPDGWVRRSFSPNDKYYPTVVQWGKIQPHLYQWHLHPFPGVNAAPAWDRARGNGIRVAVLDTGIVSHPDLTANVIGGWDMISDVSTAGDNNGRDNDPADVGDWSPYIECDHDESSWHGTHVAGTIGATTNNAHGIAGIAFGAKIMPVRVLGKPSLTNGCMGGVLSDVADAITWASGGDVAGLPTLGVNEKAHILNLSLGAEALCPETLRRAIVKATRDRSTVVVVSTFNENKDASGETDGGTGEWPGNCQTSTGDPIPGLVVVTASDPDGKRNDTGYGNAVDVAAPGVKVWSTVNTGTTVPGASHYAPWDGTSMAAPHVSGVAALLLSRCSRSPGQVEAALRAGARSSPNCRGCGAGIIDANLVLDQCNDGNFYENISDYPIPDNGSRSSPISVQGRSGSAPRSLQIRAWVVHPNVGHLKVELLAPGGQVFLLHNRTGNYANLNSTFTVNASASRASGNWNLRVTDAVTGQTGYINSWSLQFPSSN
ncbi:MAG: S8 family serine peptidase [Xanthomonadales bacterium]|jgi:serine protease|nr:S8 family serine peptidase [Xanthomonadales bacterium]